MPGRFSLLDDDASHTLLAKLGVDLGPLPTLYNIAPTDQIPVVHYFEGKRLISSMRWWLIPQWSDGPSTKYPMFNARCERLLESRAFQGAFRYRRCIIPASSFIEWQHDKTLDSKIPYQFSLESETLAFAGIWEYWSDGIQHVLSCAIVNRTAPDCFADYAARLPVVLTTEQAEFWLMEEYDTDALVALCESAQPDVLQVALLDAQLNDARHKAEPVVLESLSAIDFKKERTVKARWTF